MIFILVVVLHLPLGTATLTQEKTAKRKLSMIEEVEEGATKENNKRARKFVPRSITTGKIPMSVLFLVFRDLLCRPLFIFIDMIFQIKGMT